MDIEAIKGLFEDFDLAAFLPKLDDLLGWVEMALRIAVMAGPLLMLIFGLIYLAAPPKEANHKFGYRFYWGMGSVEAWRFTQRLAGVVWSALGLLLTVVMLVVVLGYGGMDGLSMVNSALTCVVWELVLIGLSCIAIDVIVALRYDREGNVRPDTRIKFTEDSLKFPRKK